MPETPSSSPRGRLITFEGGDGVGKSTQIQAVADALRARNLEIVVTREPGGTPEAEAVRDLLVSGRTDRWDPLSEALLHYAARREHMLRLVIPALETGQWVLSDRFADSTMAYQGYGQGLGREVVATLDGLVMGGLAPDLTLILDVPAEVANRRRTERGQPGSRYERFDAAFQSRVRQGFRDIARREAARAALIDASGEPAEVTAAVLAAIERRLGLS